MNYSITKNGICAEHLCVIDETNKTVSTQEDGLVFDFSNEYGWSFKTGSDCTFNTGSSCTFNTGSDCTFKTGPSCTFKTGSDCTFNAGPSCTFNTCSDCIFKVRDNCALIRWDVKGVTALPTDITIKLNEYGIAGYLANTKEWVKQNMDNEEGLAIILANDEYFDPLLLNI